MPRRRSRTVEFDTPGAGLGVAGAVSLQVGGRRRGPAAARGERPRGMCTVGVERGGSLPLNGLRHPHPRRPRHLRGSGPADSDFSCRSANRQGRQSVPGSPANTIAARRFAVAQLRTLMPPLRHVCRAWRTAAAIVGRIAWLFALKGHGIVKGRVYAGPWSMIRFVRPVACWPRPACARACR